jgi:integrase
VAEEVEIIPSDLIGPVLRKLHRRAIFPKVVVALFTGMRRGEILGLRWRNVDLAAKVLQVSEAVEETMAHGVRSKKPKSKAGTREITLPDIVVATLTEHRRQQIEDRLRLGLGKLPDDALVFPAVGGGLARPSNLSSDWLFQVQALDLPRVNFHALRHTHASALIDAGIDIVRISKRLGHADPSVTLKTYAHLFRRRDDLCADAINKAFGAGSVPNS